jgi:hypothetical protein
MKRVILIFLILIPAIFVVRGQSVVSSSGGLHQNAQGTIGWTLGETIINTHTSNNAVITQGFQQGNQINVTLNPSADSICSGSNVSVYASSSGGGTTHTYTWTSNPPGFTSNSATIQATPTVNTWFIVTVSDGGISPQVVDSVYVFVNPSDFSIAFSALQTTFTSPPFNVSIMNQTPNFTNYKWTWNMGDGTIYNTSTPGHTYGYNGTYTVSAMAQDTITGCFDTLTKTNYITCNGGGSNPCTLVAEITPSGQAIVCPNDSIKLTATSNPNATYAWIYNGSIISGATDSIFYASQSGLYQVMLTDTICSVFSGYFNLIQYPSLTPVISSNGSIAPCTNDSMELFVSTYYNAYAWSNGATTQSTYVKNSGHYSITVTDVNGCKHYSNPFTVNASLLQTPEICIVGVDSATNNNRIIYERYTTNLIDSFRIYRESTVAYVYTLIGTLPYNAPGIFIDPNSNPAQRAYRYKISAVDTCGTETPLSDYHKTIHLTINKGVAGAFNLIWDGYTGFPFGSYRIYRGIDSSNMTFITQIQSTLSSYTDLNPPSDTVYYQIEVVKQSGCYPDSIYAKVNTNYNSSRSNMANTMALIIPDTTGIHEIIHNNLEVNIYPNPNKGEFNIHLNSPVKKEVNLRIVNIIGEVIYSADKLVIEGNYKTHLDLKTMPKGLYFVCITNKESSIVRKVIIQ